MLPSHHVHKGPKKVGNLSMCIILSLSLLLIMSYGYWKKRNDYLVILNSRKSFENAELLSEISKVKETYNNLQDRVNELQNELNQAATDKSNEIDDIQNKKASLEIEIKNKESTVNELEQKNSDLESSNGEKTKEIDELKTETDQLKEEIAKLKTEIETLKASYSKEQETSKALKEEISEKSKKIEQLETSLENQKHNEILAISEKTKENDIKLDNTTTTIEKDKTEFNNQDDSYTIQEKSEEEEDYALNGEGTNQFTNYGQVDEDEYSVVDAKNLAAPEQQNNNTSMDTNDENNGTIGGDSGSGEINYENVRSHQNGIGLNETNDSTLNNNIEFKNQEV